jgi:hypothetical protein
MSARPNSAQEQRTRLLDSLRQRSISTIEARRELDIMHPAARIMELRRDGYQIEKITVDERSDCDQLHKVARYILIPTGDGVPLPAAPLPGSRA